MIRASHRILTLAAGWACVCTASGCITIAPNSPSFSWKSLTRSKVEHAAYEEKVEEAPGDPADPIALKLAYGKLMEESGQPAEARKHYAAVADEQPKNVDALIGLARLDQLNGDLAAAKERFEQAIKLAPNQPAAHYGLGQLAAEQKDWKSASESLTRAMLAAPDETQYRYALAVALTHQGDVDAALPHFIRTVGDAEAHYNVALVLQQEGQLEQAERHFVLAVTKKPELTQAQSWLAHLRKQAQPAEAVAAKPAAATAPVQPAAHQAASGTRVQQANATVDALPPPRHLTRQQLEQMQNQSAPQR